VVSALALGGCLHAEYLMQAAYGQDEIGSRARPIARALEDRSIPAETRELLALIAKVKRYGEGRGIDPTGSYERFVQLDRPAVVWVVSASHPLRFETYTWTFPIVGSVPYLGWFNERDAQRHAARLASDGWDVDLRGASAYSTLGWFDDPILSSMIRSRADAAASLVNVVLHESVHATHYVASQSSFNESLADFVADTLTPDFLVHELGWDRWKMLAYRQRDVHAERRAIRFHQAYKQLEALYASKRSDGEKLAEKQRMVEQLRQEVGFQRTINNATLAQSRTYHGGVPEFGRLLACVGGDWARFWERVKTVREDSFRHPQDDDVAAVLRPLLRHQTPGAHQTSEAKCAR
jgi:predicted aminopeptidase